MARPSPTSVAALLTLALMAAALPASALTARSLVGRIEVDGLTTEYTDGEKIFGINASANAPEESASDSKWGPDNDVSQIRITWDADSLYIAGEAVIWGNNLVILVDVLPGRGLETMRQMNSWSRNFIFSDDFRPDLFGATWDGNTAPRLLIHQGGTRVDDQQSGVNGTFRAAATFQQNQRNRAMEFAIPWSVVFLATEGLGTTPRWVPARGETLQTFPAGAQLKVVAVVTAGGDNTGGPDSAPDNTQGHSTDGNQDVIVDNYAIVDLDRNDDTGLGAGGPDGVADWGIEPKSRVTFKFAPPIVARPLSLDDIRLSRPAFAPDRGEFVTFTPTLSPPVDGSNPIDALRTVNFSAGVFDFRGRLVRTLYDNRSRPAAFPADEFEDRWDGRDAAGVLVEPGIYLIRSVLEPNASRVVRPVVVVR